MIQAKLVIPDGGGLSSLRMRRLVEPYNGSAFGGLTGAGARRQVRISDFHRSSLDFISRAIERWLGEEARFLS